MEVHNAMAAAKTIAKVKTITIVIRTRPENDLSNGLQGPGFFPGLVYNWYEARCKTKKAVIADSLFCLLSTESGNRTHTPFDTRF
jgi:hypothetical protein